jgi:hypothetical protein
MPVLLYMILQPTLSYLDYLYDLQVKANTAYLAQKAATEGRVTPQLMQEVTNNLKAIGFSEGEIHIEADTILRYRGERIDVAIRVERNRTLFPFNFTSKSQPNYYYAHNTIVSEYLD